MAVYLSPIGNGFQFLDSNGKPLNAGLLNCYAAGSSTPTNTYTTVLGNVANANPIVLGSDGRPPSEIWFTQGTAYKMVLTDSLGNTLGTYDNLWGINDPQFGQQWAVGGGTANAITATYSPANTALVDGQLLGFRAAAANTSTTPTFSPDGLTARTIVKRGGVALVAYDIPGNLAEIILRYNLANTRWELMNPGGYISTVTNSIGSDVALNNTGTFFAGPTVAQGTVGTWLFFGQVTCIDTAGAARFDVTLTDTVTTIASASATTAAVNGQAVIAVSGVLTNPVGSVRIQVKDASSTSGSILFNASGSSKDSTLTAIRIA